MIRYTSRLRFAVFALVAILSSPAMSKESFPARIPNGEIFDCANCHIDPKGGGSRNAFGKAFDANNLTWNASLAAKDSDGDGYSNGFELQDPNGAWRPGRPAPGSPTSVANPGSNRSSPSVAVEATTWGTIKSLYRD